MKNIDILFVEDDSWIRAELSQFLERYATGNLYIAVDGKDGLKQYKKHMPDIVVSDIKMPNMNGLKMVKEIKKINPNQSIIFTTAHSESSFFLEAIEMQVDGYILKPVDLDKMNSKIKEIISRIDIKEKYNQQKSIINDIARLQGNMLMVLDSNMRVIFLNDSILNFIGIKSLDNHDCMCKLFLENEGSFVSVKIDNESWIEQIRDLPKERRIVTMSDNRDQTNKTFLVSMTCVSKSQHTIISFSEITAITKEKTRYKLQAFTDELTQVNNRASFNKDIIYYLEEHKKTKTDLSITLFDLDHFKSVNDNHGHVVGDEVLISLSSLLKKQLRKTDILSRWGGEEFVVLLPNTDIESAKMVAKSLSLAISNYKFIKDIKLTCSFGVVQMSEMDTPKSLIEKADIALYRAKENGRNRIEVYSQD